MLLKDTFTTYCKVLNNNIGTAVEYMLAMEKQHARLFPLQAELLRYKFTTNTTDDYAPATPTALLHPEIVKRDISQQQPFYTMLNLIYHKNLLPNLDKHTLDYIRSQNPKYEEKEDYQVLMDLLVWSTFDQATYLRRQALIQQHKQTR